jgi:glutamine synthetase
MLLPGSMFALDIQGGTIQASGLGFDEGDADRACMPVPGSLCATPWLGPEIAQLQVQMLDHDGTPFHGDPRHVLGSIVERLRARPQSGCGGTRVLLRRPQRTVEGNAQPPLRASRAGVSTAPRSTP